MSMLFWKKVTSDPQPLENALRGAESGQVATTAEPVRITVDAKTAEKIEKAKNIDLKYYPDTKLSFFAKGAGIIIGAVVADVAALRFLGTDGGFVVTMCSAPVSVLTARIALDSD